MISEINVLAPFMEDGILCKCQGRLAVHLEFCLARRQGHHTLLDRLPTDQAVTEEEEDALVLFLMFTPPARLLSASQYPTSRATPSVAQTKVQGPCDVA